MAINPVNPSTGQPDFGNNPLALTGMSQSQLQQGTQTRIGFLGSDPTAGVITPADTINVGIRGAGLQGVGVRPVSAGVMTYDQAQNMPAQWYTNDPSLYKQFITKAIMYKLPGASPDMGLPEAGAAWDSLLQTAIKLNKANPGGKDWTPWDVLDSYNRPAGSLGTYRSGDWLIDTATGQKVKYVGPKTKTQTDRRVDLSDAGQVQAIAEQSLAQLLGRAPTDSELAQFKSTLNGYEREHPTVATSTQHLDDMGNVVSTDTTTQGGVSDAARQGLIEKGVKGTKEYGKYQSGTTYFNALMQMVGGGG